MKKTRIIFFGSSDFAAPALEAIYEDKKYQIAAVITQPDQPKGRGLHLKESLIKTQAQKYGLDICQPASLKTEAAFNEIKALKAEIGIVAAYGKIIPQNILKIFPYYILNIHPSLLPKYRGPSPIQQAILNGDKKTGVTIILLDNEMDHGPIAASEKLKIKSEKLTCSELLKVLADLGARLLVEILPKWLDGKIKPREQDHSQATYTKLLTKEDGKIDWHEPAEEIERMIRAFEEWPGAWTIWRGKRLKIVKAILLHSKIGCASNAAPGYLWLTEQKKLAVNCQPGSLILEHLQIEGKKTTKADEFLRGYPQFLGSILGE